MIPTLNTPAIPPTVTISEETCALFHERHARIQCGDTTITVREIHGGEPICIRRTVGETPKLIFSTNALTYDEAIAHWTADLAGIPA